MEMFIIDTDHYSGNFEREMCAWTTGHIGDCGVGDKHLGKYPKIAGVLQQPDEDNGCMRPCAIYPTKGYYNNGMGFQYKDGQEEEALKVYKKSVREYFGKWIKQEESYRGKNIRNWTDEAIDRSVINHRKSISDAEVRTEPHRYEAYQSVVIYFEDDTLTPELIKTLKSRAEEYTKENPDGYADEATINIEGFRIIKTVTTETEESV